MSGEAETKKIQIEWEFLGAKPGFIHFSYSRRIRVKVKAIAGIFTAV